MDYVGQELAFSAGKPEGNRVSSETLGDTEWNHSRVQNVCVCWGVLIRTEITSLIRSEAVIWVYMMICQVSLLQVQRIIETPHRKQLERKKREVEVGVES